MYTITNCAPAVAASANRLIFTARIPAALDSRAPSMLSAASWLWGTNNSWRAAFNPGDDRGREWPLS